MKFAEGLVSSLLLSLPPFHPPPRRFPSTHPPWHRTLTSWSLYHPLQVPFQPPPSSLALSATSNYPRHYGIANLPDLLQVIFAQNRFNSNLGIRLFLLYVSGTPSHIMSTRLSMYTYVHVDIRSVCMYANASEYGLSMGTPPRRLPFRHHRKPSESSRITARCPLPRFRYYASKISFSSHYEDKRRRQRNIKELG